MFEKYQGQINLFQVIEDEYRCQIHSINELFSNRFKSFIECEVNGVGALCWIRYKDEQYLFKEIEEFEYNVWGELLSEEFAHLLGFPCASYRVAILGDRRGVVTKSFLKKDEVLRLGSEIFQRFMNHYQYSDESNLFDDKTFLELYQIPSTFLPLDSYAQKKYIFFHLNNLDQVWSIIEDNKKIPVAECRAIILSLLNTLIFDILTLQLDRHPNNWGYRKTKDHYLPNILFDNQKSFGLGYRDMAKRTQDFKNEMLSKSFFQEHDHLKDYLYNQGLSFTLSVDNIKDNSLQTKDNALKVFQDLFQKSDDKIREMIIQIIQKIPDDFLESVISKLEKKNEIVMSDDLYFYVNHLFSIHIKNIHEAIRLYYERSTKNEQKF